MIYLEKKEGISALKGMGFSKTKVFNVFFLEGILISGTGILLGLFLGLGICLLQVNYTIISIPGAGIPFPVELKLGEVSAALLILMLTATIFSFFTAKFLVKETE